MDEPAAASPHTAHKPHDTAAAAAQPRATTAASSSQRRAKGGGNHISALRSLGLLHELQEYVAACVETQQQQEKELGKLKAGKKDIEKALKQKASRSSDKQPCLQQFQASEISDLPPRIRALFEDNKVLKEQARRYKQRLHEAERSAAGLEQQLLAAQSANSKLKAQLQDGDAGSKAEELAQARQQAEGLGKALEKLQHANQVLQQKLDTDGRLHRQAQASAAKERLQLEEQIQELQEQLEAREKEARSHALTAKLAQRKLEEVKASAAKAVAGINARVAEAVTAAEARHKAQEDARVHLMLCIIREPVEAAMQAQGKPQPVSPPEATSRAAGNIWSEDSSVGVSQHAVSSSYNGSLSREEAVLRLQTGARGYLARKHVRLQRQQQADALVLVRAGQKQQQQQPRKTAGIVQAAPANSSCLPMELPGLDASPAGIPAQLSASSTTPTAAAAAAAAAAARGKHSQASGASIPPAGRPVVPAPRPAQGKQPGPAAASQGRAASRKPALPVFLRAPPTPVLNAGAPHPDSPAAVGGVSARTGPGAGRAAAAGPSILASPGPGSRAALPVVARVASSNRRGRPGMAAGSILGVAVAHPAPGADSADAGTIQGGQRPGISSRSRSSSVSGEQAGGVLLPQRQSSGGGSSSSSHASLPLQRTNSAGSRGVAALAVPPVGTTAASSGMQRMNSGSSQRSAGSSPALPVVGKPPQQAGGRAAARPGSGVSRSAAAGRKAQLPNKQQQQLPAAAKPQPPVQRQPEGPAAAVSPRRASARLSKAPPA